MNKDEQIEQTNTDETECKKIVPFLIKLRSILDSENFKSIINWNEDGTQFEIHDPVQFESKVLPGNYKSQRIETFFRQLNIYNFKRLNYKRYHDGSLYRVLAFKNEYFKKDEPNLMYKINRKQNTRKSDKSTSPLANEEPNPVYPNTACTNIEPFDDNWTYDDIVNNPNEYIQPDFNPVDCYIYSQPYIDTNVMIPYGLIYTPETISPLLVPTYIPTFASDPISPTSVPNYYHAFTSESISPASAPLHYDYYDFDQQSNP
ncbi:winged helix DNA-binding domain-containing protein [Neoconidiobolus thromboides FSU 785]|nr:winged helix DNA-binding domain-containing protein [Neoconidiobolus thromboides FSU 785]